MLTDLLDSRAPGSLATAPVPRTEPAFDARPRLLRLRDALAHAARENPGRWNELPLFFFDPKRQAELEAARPGRPDRFAEVSELIAAELPALLASVEVRRVARALDGLRPAALALAPKCAAARALADLLAVPDDEVFVALDPAGRTGVRLHVRGAVTVAQLHQLLAPALSGGPTASDTVFQFFTPAALRADGTLPTGFAGCGHCLWPSQALAAVPRVNGERVVLVGPAVVRASLDVEPRFPTLAVECETLQTLNPFQTAERLSRLTGRPVPVTVENAPHDTAAVARAA